MEGGEGGREGWWREWCRVGRLWENTTKKLLLIVVVQWVSSHDDVQVMLSPWRTA